MSGGRVTSAEAGEGERLSADMVFADGTAGEFFGLRCPAADDAGSPIPLERRGCTHFMITAALDAGSAANATRFSDQTEYVWTADVADGSEVVLRRMEFIWNGVTKGHLKGTFATMAEMVTNAKQELAQSE